MVGQLAQYCSEDAFRNKWWDNWRLMDNMFFLCAEQIKYLWILKWHNCSTCTYCNVYGVFLIISLCGFTPTWKQTVTQQRECCTKKALYDTTKRINWLITIVILIKLQKVRELLSERWKSWQITTIKKLELKKFCHFSLICLKIIRDESIITVVCTFVSV